MELKIEIEIEIEIEIQLCQDRKEVSTVVLSLFDF